MVGYYFFEGDIKLKDMNYEITLDHEFKRVSAYSFLGYLHAVLSALR